MVQVVVLGLGVEDFGWRVGGWGGEGGEEGGEGEGLFVRFGEDEGWRGGGGGWWRREERWGVGVAG